MRACSAIATARTFPLSTTKNCSERTTIREVPGGPNKSKENTDRGIEKWVSTNALRIFTNVGKSVPLPWGTILKKMSGNCKITCFSLIHQF
jgi:hypothetical protein